MCPSTRSRCWRIVGIVGRAMRHAARRRVCRIGRATLVVWDGVGVGGLKIWEDDGMISQRGELSLDFRRWRTTC